MRCGSAVIAACKGYEPARHKELILSHAADIKAIKPLAGYGSSLTPLQAMPTKKRPAAAGAAELSEATVQKHEAAAEEPEEQLKTGKVTETEYLDKCGGQQLQRWWKRFEDARRTSKDAQSQWGGLSGSRLGNIEKTTALGSLHQRWRNVGSQLLADVPRDTV